MIKWFRSMLRIVKTHDSEMARIERIATNAANTIVERTTLHMDISPTRHDPCNVILVGTYRNRDYVQVYSVNPRDFADLVNQYQNMKRYGSIGRVDAPIQFKAAIDREFNGKD